MNCWYALHTKPRSEHRVARALAQRQIEAYLPETEERQPGQPPQMRPFFPGYLFMRVDMSRVSSSRWQWIPGLHRVITMDERPVPVPDPAINLIRQRLEERREGRKPFHSRFQPGDKVRFIGGPFADLLAVFEEATGPEQRVQVLLSFLGQMSRVEVDEGLLEKAPAGAPLPKPRRPRRSRGRGRPIKDSR